MTRVWVRIMLIATVAVAGIVAPLAAAQDKAPAPTVAGSWKLMVESPHGAMTMALELKVDPAGKVTGTMISEQLGTLEVAGTFTGGRLAFAVTVGPDELSFAGKLKDADTLIGMLTGHGDMACIGTRTKTR